jgi:hypothetical protein
MYVSQLFFELQGISFPLFKRAEHFSSFLGYFSLDFFSLI